MSGECLQPHLALGEGGGARGTSLCVLDCYWPLLPCHQVLGLEPVLRPQMSRPMPTIWVLKNMSTAQKWMKMTR